MQQSYPSTSPFWLLTCCLLMLQQPGFASSERLSRLENEDDRKESIIRVAGRLVEKASQRPIKGATIMVQCGDRILANRRSDEDGQFSLYIPPEKISEQHISIKIRYGNHIFVKDHLEPTTQDMLIEINGAVLFESQPIEDYKMPIHILGQPEVGRVLIRTSLPYQEPPVVIVRA